MVPKKLASKKDMVQAQVLVSAWLILFAEVVKGWLKVEKPAWQLHVDRW